MKIPQKNRSKKHENRKKHMKSPKKEHVLVVAQEIKFARLLSSNEKKTRDRALKSLKKWLLNCFDRGYEFKEDDFLRIWKGLFYAVWMSDKPLVQEELCENISGILDVFPPEHYKDALLLVKVGLRAMATDWYGIDHHRMDKCLMLVRRYLRGSLRCVARSNWSEKACSLYTKMLMEDDGILSLKTPMYARNATSMILHVIDCYLEEIAKVVTKQQEAERSLEHSMDESADRRSPHSTPSLLSIQGVTFRTVSKGEISGETVAQLVSPFCEYMCLGDNETVATSSRRLLTNLLRQSDSGLQYQEKTRAWEQMGCPDGGPDALELASDEESGSDDEGNQGELEDDSCGRLDPRAGRAHVMLTPLPVAATAVAAILNQHRAKAAPRAVRRARITIKRFEALAKNEYPLKVAPMQLDTDTAPRPKLAALSLRALEKALMTSSDELALRGLSRKHRKRLLAKTRAGVSIVDDPTLAASAAATKTDAAGDWQVEETQPAQENKKENKQHGDNKENVKKKSKKRKLDAKPESTNKKIKIDKEVVRNSKEKIIQTKKINSENAKKDADTSKPILKVTSQKNSKKPKENHEKSSLHIKKVKTTEIMQNGGAPKAKLQNGDAKSLKKKQSSPTIVAKKLKSFQKQLSPKANQKASFESPKKVKFVLKNNSKQDTIDYYKSVRQSPSIPFDSSRRPSKTNLKPSTPSPINPFFKKKWKISA